MNSHPPIRVTPVGKIRSQGELIVLGRLPKLDEESPQATFYGAHGHADFYEDRVEMFVPALLAAAAPMLKNAVPKLLAAGKAALGAATEEAAEESSEEEDAVQMDGEACKCKQADKAYFRRKRRRRGGRAPNHAPMPSPEQVEQMAYAPPQAFEDAEGSVGMTYHDGEGRFEFFLPALAGLLPAVGGLFSRLLGGKKKKKKKTRRPRRPPPPPVEEEPGEGEPEPVRRAIAKEIAKAKEPPPRSIEEQATSEHPPYDKAAAARALNILTNLRAKRIADNAVRAVQGLEPLLVPDNPMNAEDPPLAALIILQKLRMAAIQENALNIAKGAPPVEVPADPAVPPPAPPVVETPPPPPPAPKKEVAEEDEDEDDGLDEEEESDEFDLSTPDSVYDAEEI